MNKMTAVFIYIICGMISAASQILLKISSEKKHKNLFAAYCNGYVITAYTLLFGSMFISMIAMRYISYKYAPVYTTLSYVFVLLFCALILKEKISTRRCMGAGIIILGIIIFSF